MHMKFSVPTAATLLASGLLLVTGHTAPTPVGSPVVVTTYNITSGIPPEGLSSIGFPIIIHDAVEGYSIGQAVQFGHITTNQGTLALQPYQNSAGSTLVRAVYSSYVPGTTTSDKARCRNPGTPDGPVIVCTWSVPAIYNTPYYLRIWHTGDSTWSVSVNNACLQLPIPLGTFALPDDAGLIQASDYGFVEYLPWTSVEQPDCSTLPYQRSTFWIPAESTVWGFPEQTGACAGEINASVGRLGTTLEVRSGFPGQTGA
ncbi:hypothetical protein FB45DRAFT_1067772 [Roridomyces roridus]|uniref:Uncharacterized protein n=1 Tax=Roridomyces roridus TaxID=1738132 RepID=A0AAD7F9Y1_9AGAR|nr:hypothetical protein FB45DRAFT_1067772 [Roridomyces roridus]